ncbi:hypothetical protein BBJ29_000767 [Phytophthora kernoviae]|uniref:Anaphase-promoting complex subunit 4-like WD40 domain-containing protein n=1 Tax=Phytophthora kernoviae TaxID=325452 RepID=A0A3F2RYB7_9STRA|nr:hypothetical protein BBJ29_000767 [Phytophthora kernoviae]RLN65745.1 hypothetical protein BBP00_00002670 [Phytophthora kernoviae]
MTWTVPKADAVTLGELGGELYSVSPRDDAHVGDDFVRHGGVVFPPARVASAKPRPFGQRESLTQEQDEELDSGALRLLKRTLKATKTFLMDDELAVLNTAMDVAGGAAQRLLKAVTGAEDEEEEEISEDSQEAATGESIVDISWHPKKNLLAVAQLDGVVALYHVATASWDVRVLEHPTQMDVTSIEWGRFTGDVLAVACRTGVFLWKVPAKDGEPVLQDVLKHPANAPFHQVCWNADGSLLAAFAKGSRSIVVFDVIFLRKTELQSLYKPSSLHWSPTGEYLFVITEGGVSLMWETLTWKRETWEVASGGCGWSSDGRYLLVALRNNALLYPYMFQGCPPSIEVRLAIMSVHVKAQCRAGCGELGDPELNYLCVDCHADRIEILQQQDLREYMAKESGVQVQAEHGVSRPPASPVKKYRGPRPVDHAKELENFLMIPRELNPAIVARELTFLKREIAICETSKKQLRKYMIATDAKEQVDPKEWGRYEYGPPKKILNRDIDEVTELAAQLKLFCHWRKRQVQQRIELKRQQRRFLKLCGLCTADGQ